MDIERYDYQLTEEDVAVTVGFITVLLLNPLAGICWGDGQEAWTTLMEQHPDARQLQQWCAQYVPDAEWAHLCLVLRRMRRDEEQDRDRTWT